MSRRTLAPLLICLAFCGCDEDKLDPTYGRATGPGSESVNGLAVLARMFQQSGFDVQSIRRLSPKLEQYDAIIWAPDDMAPPSREVRSELEQWLTNEGGRTLVYIGRDYDAVLDYWQRVHDDVPDAQRREAERRRATARSHHDARRAAAPHDQYARWFTQRHLERPTRIQELDDKTPWSDGLDPSQLQVPVTVVLEEARNEDVATLDAGETPQGFDERALAEYLDIMRDLTVPATEVLLGSEAIPLVLRVQDESMRAVDSQVIVVVNGSLLLNLPLVQPQNRELAGRLIETVDASLSDSEPRLAFLETGPGGPPVLHEEPQSQYPTGLEVFGVWPLGLILVHLMGLGIVACFAMFPIFGRPRQPPERRATYFSAHVRALGEMLAQSKDPDTARQQIEHYQQTLRGGSEVASEEEPREAEAESPAR